MDPLSALESQSVFRSAPLIPCACLACLAWSPRTSPTRPPRIHSVRGPFCHEKGVTFGVRKARASPPSVNDQSHGYGQSREKKRPFNVSPESAIARVDLEQLPSSLSSVLFFHLVVPFSCH